MRYRFAELFQSGGGVRTVKLILCAAFLLAAASAQTSADPTITTVAGTGETAYGGDGGAAVEAQLNFPRGVAVDGAGNFYIADTENHRIRKVDPSGVITTIAGTGRRGFGGDGALAVQAGLSSPWGVAVDGAGNLYIADVGNYRIRKVDRSGIITTIAGTGRRGFSGDGGPAVHAQLNHSARDLAVDTAGNLYIADKDNHRIRKVDRFGIITTVAGTGERNFGGDGGPATAAHLNDPGGVALDNAGNLYIADTDNQRIRKVDPSGIITTIAGSGRRGFGGDGGPATAARLHYPLNLVVDGAGNLYISDSYNSRIRKVDPSGIITTIAGTGRRGFSGDGGPAVQAQLHLPRGVALDGAGNLYIADTNNSRIRFVQTKSLLTGDRIYYFPHLSVGASWQTTITYINYSSREVACVTEFLSDHGTPLPVSFPGRGMLDSRTDVLPPGGSVHEETDVELGAPLAPGWAMAACTGPVKASLLFRQYDSEGEPVAEAGVNATIVPATRFVTFAEQAEGKSGTGVAYANPSATPAVVTFTARDTSGQTLASVVRTVLPKGHDAQVMAGLIGFTSFTGSLEITSTEPIVSLSLNFEAAPVFSSLPPGEVDEPLTRSGAAL